MEILFQLIALSISAWGAYSLYKGELRSRGGVIRRTEKPLIFWLYGIMIVLLGLCMFAAVRYHFAHL